MLLQEKVTDHKVYPTVEVLLHHEGTDRTYLMPSGCFHDLFSATDQELAGMGLAIIGNLCKVMQEAEESALRLKPLLQLSLSAASDPIPLPWPGLPDDNPYLPMRPEVLPFEAVMFFNGDGHGQRRVDRMALMQRIEAMWVPYLKMKLWART